MNFIDKATLLDGIKQEFGLVPAIDESITEFEKRVSETVSKKQDPLEHIVLKSLKSAGVVANRNTTHEVQDLLYKYLGIHSGPLDAFETKHMPDALNMGGFTTEQEDGSAIIVTRELPDNSFAIEVSSTIGLAYVLRDTLPEISFDPLQSGIGKAIISADLSFSDDPLEARLKNYYCMIIDELFKNSDFIMFHEGIHAIHLNNHNYGRRKKTKNKKPTNPESKLKRLALSYRLPIIGSITRAKRFNFTVETEAFAYKVGLDVFVTEILKTATQNLKEKFGIEIHPGELDTVEKLLKQYNSKFTKAIIREGYLNTFRGYGFAHKNYGSALLNGMYGGILLGTGVLPLQIVGGLMLIKGANQTSKIPFAAYFERKIEKFVDTLDRLSEEYGGANKAFYETLGMNYSEIKKLEKTIRSSKV
ncbi:hypothetical protein HN587_04150 [Candidatus Woesearchaeota archaeon]|jgi:hypothetical protein|nr:hypothetical protein [Candidatus Woesearchaeota archaeon]